MSKIISDNYSENWWIEYYFNAQPHKCCDCKFANEYAASWWFPHFDPKCSKGHSCNPDKHACCDFEMIGRLSR